MRTCWRSPWILVLLLALLAATPWQGIGRAQPKANLKKPDLVTDLDEAIRLLEAKDGLTFVEKFAPVEELRKLRQADRLEREVQQFNSMPADRLAKFVAVLKELRQQKPTYDSSKGLATFNYTRGANTTSGDRTAAILPPEPTGKVAAGYGGNLKAVLAACVQAAEKKDFRTLATKMYPPREALRLQQPREMEAFEGQMASYPAMGEALLADLKAMQAQQPKMTSGGTVAEFTVKRPNGPNRIVKLQKIGSDWRFFDEGKRVNAEIQRIAATRLPDYTEAGTAVTAQMELVGGNWRFVKLPPP